jgi:hypothetical protein
MSLSQEKQDLFRMVKTKCGFPIRKIPITDEQLCDMFEMCVGDYAEKVQNFIIENQWQSLYGKQISTTDMAFALSVRAMDTATDWSHWFSKEVGLQQDGPWELKKDFFTVEPGKQSYIIPAGRTINKVLFMTPSTMQAALFANIAGIDIGFGGGFAQLGGAASAGPMAGYYIMPAYDTMLLSADMNLKQRLLRSDLIYKVTGGPNGTRIIHLLSTPGSKLTFSYSTNGASGLLGLAGCQVWYTYYSTDKDDENSCLAQNPDTLLTPDQVPLNKMDYDFFNDPTKVIIRQLLTAETKILLGNIRGTNSGKIPIPDAMMELDYQIFLQQGKEEREKVMNDLVARLERLSPNAQMEKMANIADNQKRVLSNIPLGLYVI